MITIIHICAGFTADFDCSSGPAAVVEGLWVTLICPLLSETQQEENQLKTLTIYLKKWIDIKLVLHKPWAKRCESPDEDDDEGHVDEDCVCVSDEVLNSQHYKHSPSTEHLINMQTHSRSLPEECRDTVLLLSIFTNTVFIFHFQKQTYNDFMLFWVKLLPNTV